MLDLNVQGIGLSGLGQGAFGDYVANLLTDVAGQGITGPAWEFISKMSYYITGTGPVHPTGPTAG